MAQYTQQSILKWNNLDDIGALLDLSRNPDESNESYQQRLLKLYVNRAAANYDGLINGISNEFGLPKFMTISITSVFSDYDIYVTASRVILTSGNTTESYIFRYTGDDGYVYVDSLTELCDKINLSDNWSASVDSSIGGYLCDCLLIQSNNKHYNMTIPATNRISIGKVNIVTGTVSFNEKDIFNIEIPFSNMSDPFSLLTVDGDYTIDCTNGIIYTKSVPRGYGIMVCDYKELPYQLIGSSCNIYNFHDIEFMSALYKGDYMLSHELQRYIRELYVQSNQTWGK